MIGRVISKEFHQNGWKVYIFSRNPQKYIDKFPFALVRKWGSESNLAELKSIINECDLVVNLGG